MFSSLFLKGFCQVSLQIFTDFFKGSLLPLSSYHCEENYQDSLQFFTDDCIDMVTVNCQVLLQLFTRLYSSLHDVTLTLTIFIDSLQTFFTVLYKEFV
ncbi:hypothetical protein LPLM1_00068 [Listeria phage LPML1]|nr:hypothetical protein LPLM1_00068 [Listeria phage LPML1]